ncbi:MAG: hypothetical protein FWE05_11835, partial [Defluviitaleaceae bacterium]|nr:hypothetical protein [Defluviitaleaceae bacterium]
MRISHLELRRRLNDTKSKITNKQFFKSSLFKGYLADMADATGNRYKKPIKINLDWDSSDNADVAFTDNQLIYINAGNPMTKKLATRELKMLSLIGILAHEVGHILFTDFQGLGMFTDALKIGKFYPKAPDVIDEIEAETLDELQSYIQGKGKMIERAKQLIITIASSLLNVIEDVYIESRMCHKFPGLYKSGIELMQTLLKKEMKSLSEQIDDEKIKPLSIAFSLVLQYARFGDINNPDRLENEYTEVLYRCTDYIDEAVYSEDVNMRYNAANKIMLNLWFFIKQALDNGENNGDEEGENENSAGSGSPNGTSGSIDSALQEILEQLGVLAKQAGGTSQPKGENTPIQSDPSNTMPKSRAGNKDKDSKTSNSSAGNSTVELGGGKEEKPSQKATSIAGKNTSNEKTDDESINEVIGVGDSDEDMNPQQFLEEEAGRFPLMETESFESDGDGLITRDHRYEGSGYDSAAS